MEGSVPTNRTPEERVGRIWQDALKDKLVASAAELSVAVTPEELGEFAEEKPESLGNSKAMATDSHGAPFSAASGTALVFLTGFGRLGMVANSLITDDLDLASPEDAKVCFQASPYACRSACAWLGTTIKAPGPERDGVDVTARSLHIGR